jgi:Na+-transporting NADH:ubiquinone oxidoreductase subunit C
MRKGHGTVYVLGFAAGICLVCSLAISSLAIGLAPLKDKNIEIDKKKNVLAAAGLMVEKEQVLATFKEKLKLLKGKQRKPVHSLLIFLLPLVAVAL